MRVKIIVQESYKTTQPVSLPFKEIAAYYLQLMGYAVSDSLHDAVLHISSKASLLVPNTRRKEQEQKNIITPAHPFPAKWSLRSRTEPDGESSAA
jgi:hypothetical protein